MPRNLWAPWRISYLEGLVEPAPPRDEGCFLCATAASPLTAEAMREHLLLLSDSRGVLLLNRYPYTNGHLLVAPREHVGDLSDLTREQRHGLMDLADLSNRLLRASLNPQGVNLGMNLEPAAELHADAVARVLTIDAADDRAPQVVALVRAVRRDEHANL